MRLRRLHLDPKSGAECDKITEAEKKGISFLPNFEPSTDEISFSTASVHPAGIENRILT